MKEFILVFPLPCKKEEVFSITEFVKVEAQTEQLLIPGSLTNFKVRRQDRSESTSAIFSGYKIAKEEMDFSPEDIEKIDNHQSLLFLIGTIKSFEDLRQINRAILKILDDGALGVLFQENALACTPAIFKSIVEDEDELAAWVNFVSNETSIFTLGLEIFSLPDLCISTSLGTEVELASILAATASFILEEGITPKSGLELPLDETTTFVLRKEDKTLFKKTSPEFNKQGVLRMVKK